MAHVLNKKSGIIPRDAIYIGRPSKWGNPFVIGKHGNREQVIARYECALLSNSPLMASLHKLRGKSLVCWCAPLTCRGDVLLRLANKLM